MNQSEAAAAMRRRSYFGRHWLAMMLLLQLVASSPSVIARESRNSAQLAANGNRMSEITLVSTAAQKQTLSFVRRLGKSERRLTDETKKQMHKKNKKNDNAEEEKDDGATKAEGDETPTPSPQTISNPPTSQVDQKTKSPATKVDGETIDSGNGDSATRQGEGDGAKTGAGNEGEGDGSSGGAEDNGPTEAPDAQDDDGAENDDIPSGVNEDGRVCEMAAKCEACLVANDELDVQGKVCWWDGELCRELDEDGHDSATMCTPDIDGGQGGTEPVVPTVATASPSQAKAKETASPTSSPTASPTLSPTKGQEIVVSPAPSRAPVEPEPVAAPVELPPVAAPVVPMVPTTSETPGAKAPYDDDAYKFSPLQDIVSANGTTIAMGLVVLFMLYTIMRRVCCRSGGSGGAMPGRSAYQGLSSADSDDEWGWDGEEDTNLGFSPPKSMELPVHRVHESPIAKAHESPRETAKPAVRGMSLKGAKSLPITQRPAQASKARQPPAPLPRAPPPTAPIVKPPKPDDFFAEMGLEMGSTSKASASASASRWTGKSLGATPLPSGTSDLGDDDNWNDDDLDDLLND